MLILSSRVNPDLPDSVSCSLSVYEPVGCLGNAGHVQYRTLGFVFVTASIIMCMCVGCVLTSVISHVKLAMFCKHQHKSLSKLCECKWRMVH